MLMLLLGRMYASFSLLAQVLRLHAHIKKPGATETSATCLSLAEHQMTPAGHLAEHGQRGNGSHLGYRVETRRCV